MRLGGGVPPGVAESRLREPSAVEVKRKTGSWIGSTSGGFLQADFWVAFLRGGGGGTGGRGCVRVQTLASPRWRSRLLRSGLVSPWVIDNSRTVDPSPSSLYPGRASRGYLASTRRGSPWCRRCSRSCCLATCALGEVEAYLSGVAPAASRSASFRLSLRSRGEWT